METFLAARRDAVSNWIVQTSTIVDVGKRLYKIQQSLFGIFKWGSFRSLPGIDYVLIFRSLFVKCEACSFEQGEDNPNAYYQVSLVYNKNRRIILKETKDRRSAFGFAEKAAASLRVRLRDSATVRGKSSWLTFS